MNNPIGLLPSAVLKEFAFIGVVREFMNRELFSKADEQSIAIVKREVSMLKKLGALVESPNNDHFALACTLGANSFSIISVPAGFTSHIYDRVPDATSPDGTRLLEPIPAQLPVNIDFLGRPFSEPVLFRIAAAYEAASKHRKAPKGFGELQ